MFPCLSANETFVAETFFCFQATKNVSDYFQKHFVSATNVSPIARQGNNVDWILLSRRLDFLKWASANVCFQFLGLAGKDTLFPFVRPRNVLGNNVSATMFPRLRGPLRGQQIRRK